MFNLFKPFDIFKIGYSRSTYNPLINYDWSTTTTSGLRHLKDVGSTPTYNASMYFGRGAYLNGVDQTITVPINTTIKTALKRVNGVVTINETSQTLTNYVISGLGVHKDYYLFTRLLTTTEKDSYTNTPELFYAMAQADSTCVLNMPMCETDGYARNMKSYSLGSELLPDITLDSNGVSLYQTTYLKDTTTKLSGTSSHKFILQTGTAIYCKVATDVTYEQGGYYYISFYVKVSSAVTTSVAHCFLTTSNKTELKASGIPIGGWQKYEGIVLISNISEPYYLFAYGYSTVTGGAVWIDGEATIKQLTGTYPTTNYTTSVRDNANNLQYGLQTCKFVRDGLGVIQSASNYLECDGVGYATIPSHTNKVNIKMTVNPTSLSGNLLSGGVTKTLTGLTLNADNDVVISNVTPTGTITLASGFTGTIKSYKEELV